MNQEELFNIYFKNKNKKTYKKILKPTSVRKPNGKEIIITNIDGIKETQNIALEDHHVIIKGEAGEEYAIPIETFQDRYNTTDITLSYNYCPVFPKPVPTYGFEYKGKKISFKASWGEDMICEDGDFLLSPKKDEYGDIYRIEKNIFFNTYIEEKNI